MMDRVMDEVLAEVAAATRKFPTWPTDPLHALAVLGEEFGELTKDVLQLTYEPHKTNAANVRKEAIQTAAMALRFAASLDAYEYRRGVQHSQGAAPKAASEGDQYIGMTLAELDRNAGVPTPQTDQPKEPT
jgi:NTP pyrophosphatase (non-canonical NTP hydrolase)